MKLGDKLKKLRNDSGKSMSDVYADTGVTTSYISDLENNNKKNPSLNIIGKLADYYNVSVDWLMGNSNIKKREYEVPESVAQYLNRDEEDFFKKALNNDKIVMLMKDAADMKDEDLAKFIFWHR